MSQSNSPPKMMLQLHQRYKRTLEISIILTLLTVSTLFYSFKSFEPKSSLIAKYVPEPTEVIIMDRTIQMYKPPVPPQPVIPVPSDDPEISDEVTWDINDIDIEELIKDSGAPPPDDQEEAIPFVFVSEKPEIVKKVQPIYPELARKAHIEGMVVVEILIDKKGNVEKTEVIKSIPMLDEAAVDAAMQCKFTPGKQRDKFVKVKMAIPFSFKLK